ncbi:hypothetical protein Tco_1452517, partial [Tanacetum coccineum]
ANLDIKRICEFLHISGMVVGMKEVRCHSRVVRVALARDGGYGGGCGGDDDDKVVVVVAVEMMLIVMRCGW